MYEKFITMQANYTAPVGCISLDWGSLYRKKWIPHVVIMWYHSLNAIEYSNDELSLVVDAEVYLYNSAQMT